MSTAIIILAAGNSSRLGEPKQLLDVGNKKLLQHTIDEAIKSNADEICVVLGYLADQLSKKIPQHVHMVENKNWTAGMGSSLKSGLKACIEKNSDNIIISVADQPLLSFQIFNRLLSAPHNHQVITSKYDDQNFGPPVLFRRPLFDELMTIDDSFGAKKIIQQHTDDLYFINFPEGKLDIDTQKDYQEFINK